MNISECHSYGSQFEYKLEEESMTLYDIDPCLRLGQGIYTPNFYYTDV